MSLFDLIAPDARRIPVLVEVPHAGLAVPERVRHELAAPRESIVRDADSYVDVLYRGAPMVGATMLAAKVSRYVVDLNRDPDDVDALTVIDHPAPRSRQPRGVVWRMTTDGANALRRPLTYRQLTDRIVTYWQPYHAAVQTMLADLSREFGHVVLLAAHSMPSIGRVAHHDPGRVRADVVPGTRGRTTSHSSVIDAVERHFTRYGLTVRHDDPYRGGYTTGHYGRPNAGIHAIQIELNRALYMDERSGRPKEQEFSELQRILDELVVVLGQLRPR